MKRIITFFVALLITTSVWSQINNLELPLSIKSNGLAPDNSAMLDVQSLSKGILIPRMTTPNRLSIPSPATGLLVYDVDTRSFWYFSGLEWMDLNAADYDWHMAGGTLYSAVDSSLIIAPGVTKINGGTMTHALTVQNDHAASNLRLIGPEHEYLGYGARMNFGDAEYVFLEEDEDDQLTIHAEARIAFTGGLVGIGTLNPNHKLHVDNGNMLIEGSAGYDSPGERAHIYLGSAHQSIYAEYGAGLRMGAYGAADILTLQELSGNVGIKENNPSHPLHLGSGAHCTSSGVWTNASDISKKYNVENLTYGLEEVRLMNPKSFKYKADHSRGIGFIAQEMEKIVPEIVSGEEGEKGIAYGMLTAVLANAMQEQQMIIEAQGKEIEQLSMNYKALVAEIHHLRAMLEDQNVETP